VALLPAIAVIVQIRALRFSRIDASTAIVSDVAGLSKKANEETLPPPAEIAEVDEIRTED
jgi:hypothetical protein